MSFQAKVSVTLSRGYSCCLVVLMGKQQGTDAILEGPLKESAKGRE